MSKASFVYVTYIKSTPERVWQAITDGEFSHLYWANRRNTSDWQVGSEWRHEDYDDGNLLDVVGKVLESDPPRRLVIDWAFPREADDPEKVSRVAFDIEPLPDIVRLTVAHTELEPNSDMLRGISGGWPLVLSSLKSFLETGEAWPAMRTRLTKPPE